MRNEHLNKINVSFEFFPPKDSVMENSLWKNLRRLEPLEPQFISVTYGAGGSTRDRTHKLVKQIKLNTKLEPAAHLTCIGSNVYEIEEIAEQYWDDGIRHIVALRGDIPEENSHLDERLKYATDLIKLLKKKRPPRQWPQPHSAPIRKENPTRPSRVWCGGPCASLACASPHE